MTSWLEILAHVALSHLWQSAAIGCAAWLVLRWQRRMSASSRAWVLLCAFSLAAVTPFVMLRSNPLTSVLPTDLTRVQTPVAITYSGSASHPVDAIGAPHELRTQPNRVVGSRANVRELSFAAMMVLWLLGTLWSVLRLAREWNVISVLRKNATPITCEDLLPNGGLRVPVPVRLSGTIASPMVVGLIRPYILFPTALLEALSSRERELVLRHEVAHLRRGDLWTSLFQSLCLAVFWWSPVLRLIRLRLDAAREMACDEQAAGHPDDALAYADALLKSASSVLKRRSPLTTFAACMSGGQRTFTHRIQELIDMTETKVHKPRSTAVACVTMIAVAIPLALLAAPRNAPTQQASQSTIAVRSMGRIQDAGAQQPDKVQGSTANGAGVNRIIQGTGTPLIVAARQGNIQKVNELLSRGAKVDEGAPQNGTPLIVAARRNDVQMVDALLKHGANVNEGEPGDGTPLIAASRVGDVAVVKDLLNHGALVNKSLVGDGNSLIAASAGGHLEVVQALVEAGAKVNAIVPDDETPLINASRSGDLATVQYLIEHGAKVNLGVVTDAGQYRSPLNQAKTSAIKNYLVKKGAVKRS